MTIFHVTETDKGFRAESGDVVFFASSRYELDRLIIDHERRETARKQALSLDRKGPSEPS